MNKSNISKDTEKKRLRDFETIAENWDKLPKYSQGKIDGVISAIASIFCENNEGKAG